MSKGYGRNPGQSVLCIAPHHKNFGKSVPAMGLSLKNFEKYPQRKIELCIPPKPREDYLQLSVTVYDE